MNLHLMLAILIGLFGCSESLNHKAADKIRIFEQYEDEFFDGISLQILRHNPNVVEFEVRKIGVPHRAIVQVQPDRIIFDQFRPPYDSISIEMLDVVASMQIRGMYSYDSIVPLEFWHEQDYVILYRNRPYNRLDIFQNSTPIHVKGDWDYFTFDLKTN